MLSETPHYKCNSKWPCWLKRRAACRALIWSLKLVFIGNQKWVIGSIHITCWMWSITVQPNRTCRYEENTLQWIENVIMELQHQEAKHSVICSDAAHCKNEWACLSKGPELFYSHHRFPLPKTGGIRCLLSWLLMNGSITDYRWQFIRAPKRAPETKNVWGKPIIFATISNRIVNARHAKTRSPSLSRNRYYITIVNKKYTDV